jgi:mRNA interferase RelE/StbE
MIAGVATVILTAEARAQLDELPAVIHLRVLKILQRLEHWPNVSGAKPLSGKLAGHYRVRTGDYRVQFYPTEQNTVVVITKIGHRDGFYE